MSTNARRSPRNHGSTATMGMNHLPTNSNNSSNPSASSSGSTSRHLSSTTRNQPNGHPASSSRTRCSGSPKETRTSGASIPFHNPHTYTSTGSSAPVASSGGPAGVSTSGLGIVGAIMHGSMPASGSGSSSSVNSNVGNATAHPGFVKPSPHGATHPHHYSPYHTRSTPNLTTGSTSASCSPVLLSPTGSPAIGSAAGFRDTPRSANPKDAGLPEIIEPIVYGAADGETRPVTPTRNRKAGPVLSKSPERDLPAPGTGTAKYRAGLSVEGILMQSGGADKVNTGAIGSGGLMGTRGMRSVKGKGVDYGDR